jgi:DNA replication and repair protein RecF
MVSQTDKEYYRALVEYRKVKQERNVLLQRIRQRDAKEEELSFWDKELVRLGNIIIEKRETAIEALNVNLPSCYQKISGDEKSVLKIIYKRNFEGGLEENLHRYRFREIASGNTIFGPHRDDLMFLLNEKNMDNFASRGEIKSAILALKICELKFVENALEQDKNNRNYKSPILLLDDIFSEFDPERRAHLGGLIAEYQSLITSTETANLPPELLKNCKVVELT